MSGPNPMHPVGSQPCCDPHLAWVKLTRARQAWAIFSKRHEEARGHTYGCPAKHQTGVCLCGLDALRLALET